MIDCGWNACPLAQPVTVRTLAIGRKELLKVSAQIINFQNKPATDSSCQWLGLFEHRNFHAETCQPALHRRKHCFRILRQSLVTEAFLSIRWYFLHLHLPTYLRANWILWCVAAIYFASMYLKQQVKTGHKFGLVQVEKEILTCLLKDE